MSEDTATTNANTDDLGAFFSDNKSHHTAVPLPPGPNHDERLAAVQAAIEAGRNPLMEAARPLLRALAEMPDDLSDAGAGAMHTLLTTEMVSFTRLCEQANIRRDHMLATRYALCTALDESVNLKPWAGGVGQSTGMWSTKALLSQFHHESEGGKKVFLLIGRLAHSPEEHMHVLEVIYQLLSLGFMGDYRVQVDGHRLIERIRHRLFTMITTGVEPVARELSPRWRGAGQGKFKLLRAIPVWVSASVLGLTLFGMFGWYTYQLQTQRQQVLRDIEALAHLRPAPVQAAAMDLPTLLQPEVEAGTLSVQSNDAETRVLFQGDGMFSGGLTRLSASTSETLRRVGAAVMQVSGLVEVIGHTDSQPIRSAQFPDNLALSQARAQAVADVLIAQGLSPQRLSITGVGDAQPLSSNASAAGRAKNRRVELVVSKAAATDAAGKQ